MVAQEFILEFCNPRQLLSRQLFLGLMESPYPNSADKPCLQRLPVKNREFFDRLCDKVRFVIQIDMCGSRDDKQLV